MRSATCSRARTSSAGSEPDQPGIGPGEDERHGQVGIAVDEFKGECASEGVSDHVGPTDVELADAFGESVGVVGEPERFRWVCGVAAAGCVPGDHGEFAAEVVDLVAPHTAVAERTVQEDDCPATAGAAVADAVPGDVEVFDGCVDAGSARLLGLTQRRRLRRSRRRVSRQTPSRWPMRSRRPTTRKPAPWWTARLVEFSGKMPV